MVLAPAALAQDDDGDDEAAEASADGDDEASDVEARIEQLEQELTELKERMAEDELQRLLDKAEQAANAPPEEPQPEDRVFVAGSRSLQATNPEISVSGEIVAGLTINDDIQDGNPVGTGFPLRALSLHIQSVLDPYSTTKIAVAILPDPEEPIALEEMYITWYGLVPSLSLSVGRFRQQFGVVNRWHEHDLDQVDHPLAMRQVIGDEGFAGDGLSLRWFMPKLWAHANELTLDVVDGNNELLYSGERFAVPAFTGHLKNYWDLSPATYLELGLSGALGWNNPIARDETREEATTRGADPDANDYEALSVDDGWSKTVAAGANLTLFWNPPQKAKYRSFTWRSEFYYVQKEDVLAQWTRAWGVYSYVQVQPAASWFLGVRGDVAHPLVPAVENLVWDVVPYITWWQSEFVFLRLEYGFTHGLTPNPDHRIAFQVSWAAGPHKHERY
jgi:hypothetical protein